MDTTILEDIYRKVKGYITSNSKVILTNPNIPLNSPDIIKYLIEVPKDLEIDNTIDCVYICVYATYISIKSLPTTKLIDKDVFIKPYLDKLRLMRFNKRTKRNELIWRFYLYHIGLFEYRTSRHSLNNLIACLESQECPYKIIYENFTESNDIEIGINSNWKPRENQVPIIEFLCNKEVGTIRATKLQTGEGKGLVLDALIKVPNGWRYNKDIRIGDTVTSFDGSFCKVIGVYPQEEKDIYEITFEDDRKVKCDSDHLWKVYTGRNSIVYTTSRLLKEKYTSFSIPLCKSEQIEDIKLQDDPYTLGLAIYKEVSNYIPSKYVLGSHKQRLDLLKGILGVGKQSNLCLNPIIYKNNSKLIIEKVQYLVRSLGGTAKLINDNELEIKYHSRLTRIKIKDIKYIGKEKTQCIKVDNKDELYITNDFIVTHNTSISIFSLDILKKPTMIICAGLVEQWTKNIKDITKVDDKDIFIIQGSDSIHKLFKEGREYKIYIASLGTLRSWITNGDSIYTDVPTYEEFLHKFKIGTKIIDEFHLNFAAIVSIDLRSNIESNIYLSATPIRADKNTNRIFTTVFPYDNIIGSAVINRYVNTTQYSYSLHIPRANRVVTQYGYSHTKYEAIVLSREEILHDFIVNVLKPLVDSHYINKFDNGKLLIFASTVAMVTAIYRYLKFYYQDKTVNTYVAQDPKTNLEISDIIISTPKSCGTGVDIKNLVCAINTVTVSSEALVRQMFGRLRKLPDGRTPEYVDIYNRDIPSQINHSKSRFRIYRQYSNKFELFHL